MDDEAVYWTTLTTPEIWTASKDGTGARVLVTGNSPVDALTQDSAYLYWADSAGVRRTPKSGTATKEVLRPYQLVDALVIWNGHLVTARDSEGPIALDLVTRTETLLVTDTSARGLTTNDSSVFWTSPTLTGRALRAYDGGPTARIVIDSGSVSPPLAVDATTVYFDGSAGIGTIPVSGGTPSTFPAPAGFLRDIAVDATAVYWIDQSSFRVTKRVKN